MTQLINQSSHPVQVFKDENVALQKVITRINDHLTSLEIGAKQENVLGELKNDFSLLGEFRKHYDRKEKLIFPIMERYGHYALSREIWAEDDEVRGLYREISLKIEQLPDTDLKPIRKTFYTFADKFKKMVHKEESIVLPKAISCFSEKDWFAVANESDAFGFAIITPEEQWEPAQQSSAQEEAEESETNDKNIAFGGGFLTLNEANHILNNLPLEITFVDKNDVFKYFNQRTDPSDMMLVRTPSSVGRIVGNCHPPKSLLKVMTIIRDLKNKKRTSESMWFKKKDQYIHITYKGVFDEDGEYLGILEYVQDIQPFLELPSEFKTEISKLDE